VTKVKNKKIPHYLTVPKSNQKSVKYPEMFSAKHEKLRRKSKDRLGQNKDNMSALSDMSTGGLSFQ
jgi:hypothetical protein